MATNNTHPNSRHTPTPPQKTTSLLENTTPLQYDDPQRFRDYAHSIAFGDDDLSTDDMFANPAPLPELEIPSII